MTSRHVRYVREFRDNNNHKGAQSTLVACGPLKAYHTSSKRRSTESCRRPMKHKFLTPECTQQKFAGSFAVAVEHRRIVIAAKKKKAS